jgi:hypothetical protein
VDLRLTQAQLDLREQTRAFAESLRPELEAARAAASWSSAVCAIAR